MDIPSSLSVPKFINPLTFLKQVRSELVKVDWPTRQQTIRLTGLVIIASILVGVYIGGLDTIFTLLFKNLVK